MPPSRPREPSPSYEVEALQGTVPWLRSELLTAGFKVLASHADGVRVSADGAGRGGRRLLELRSATNVYRRVPFAVPRPKALLGDEHFRRLLREVTVVRDDADFEGFRLAAAGRDSTVFRRLADALRSATGLSHRPEDGELLLRVRPDPHADGWEVLIRLGVRPLSARRWRACNRPGGLNASLAAVMNALTGQAPNDRYLNLMCGSGTLLVERALAAPSARLVGIDLDPEAIDCSRANAAAAGVAGECELVRGDVLAQDAAERLGAQGFDVLTADPPWGDAVGDHASNAALYPALLRSASALAAPEARFALLTHEVRLARSTLERQSAWRVEVEERVAHGGHFPCLYLLRPSATAAPGATVARARAPG